MYVADAMRLLGAVLACALCAALNGEQRWGLFSAVQSLGRTQCSPLPPLLTLRARSRIDCSDQCVGQEGCVEFNFKQAQPNCELFNQPTSNNAIEVSGCALYQMDPGLCTPTPCLNRGTPLDAGPSHSNCPCLCAPLFTGAQCETFLCVYTAQQGNPSSVFNVVGFSSSNEASQKEIYCENFNGTTYLVIQRRQDGSVNFTRNWTDYEQGFGSVNGEFWFGNMYLAQLSTYTSWLLRFDMWDWSGDYAWEEYSNFSVGDATTKYTLSSNMGSYSIQGTAEARNGVCATVICTSAGDCMTFSDAYGPSENIGKEFTTYDRNNDVWGGGDCTSQDYGGWWYSECGYSNPNGVYNSTERFAGIVWYKWKGWNYSLKKIEMKIRPTA